VESGGVTTRQLPREVLAEIRRVSDKVHDASLLEDDLVELARVAMRATASRSPQFDGWWWTKGSKVSASRRELAAIAWAASGGEDLAKALRYIRPHAQHEANGLSCPTCDPGNEGAEIWGELVDRIDAALSKVQK
jgi:hypothetical protein